MEVLALLDALKVEVGDTAKVLSDKLGQIPKGTIVYIEEVDCINESMFHTRIIFCVYTKHLGENYPFLIDELKLIHKGR